LRPFVHPNLFGAAPAAENPALKAMWFLFGHHDALCGTCAAFAGENATSPARCRQPEAGTASWKAWYAACGKFRGTL